jgi:3-oxoacyl-[acyl-carrier-protein] synthase II
MTRRVAITGCGVVTAAGAELDAFWRALMDGTCFIKPLRGFTAPDMQDLVGAAVELPAADALPAGTDSDPRRARCVELALAASRRAFADAGIAGVYDGGRVGVAFGTTMGEERQIADLSERVAAGGAASVDAGFLMRSNNQRLAALIAEQHDLGGPVFLTATACSSGNAAIGAAYDLIASGEADAMVAGGADTFTRLIYCGFTRMSALSKGVCKPFDKQRDGVSFGEGAGVIVLEDLERARRRGARVYAELAGYGISNDAHHITAPGPNGDGFVRAMRQAMEQTGVALEQVSYVSAHGTGTPYNDLGECQAMQAVFGEHGKHVPISSIKSMIGHTNGAASAIEAVVCALALQHQALPPTAGLSDPEADFGLDFVPNKGRPARVETCFSLAAGFGGHNVCLVLKKVA